MTGGVAFIEVELLLPYCTFENEPDVLRETIKSNIIARYSSIFRVSRILLYNSRKREECLDHRDKLLLFLSYFRTPPYLRKKIFGRKKELKYAGIAYPVQIPSHNVKKKPTVGEIREGLVLSADKEKALIDVGLKAPVWVRTEGEFPKKKSKVFVRVVETYPLRLELLSEPDRWIGYEVGDVGSLVDYLINVKKKRAVIGTSRLGEPIWKNAAKVIDHVKEKGGRVTLVYGEPYRGLYDIARDLSFDIEDYFDGIYNFVVNQGTKTVRTEEAIAISLSILSFMEGFFNA
ncbi:MAG: hypothetical protein JHC28_05475 [Thermoprotei archaeon]|nr:hypothetical protein [Thermoprotei archaeon]